jgi:hypothetical protein
MPIDLDFAVAGIIIVPLIVALVAALKRAGMNPGWEVPSCIVLGLLAVLGWEVTQVVPAALPWFQSVVLGLALGLSATGLYNVGRSVRRALRR